MKKLMSMLLVGIMLVSMVGCEDSFKEGYEDGKEAANSSEEKSTMDEYMEENEEEYEAEEQVIYIAHIARVALKLWLKIQD